MLHQDPSQRPSAREALEALISIDASAHINGPLRLYPNDLAVPAHSDLMAVLTNAIPDVSMQPLLQKIVQHVTSHARGALFTNEMHTYGLTLLEAYCICAYTCDATHFGQTREESPFYMYDRQCACAHYPSISHILRHSVITRHCAMLISAPSRDGLTFRCCSTQL